jgi:dTDP-4-dehydrorhamnose reductase
MLRLAQQRDSLNIIDDQVGAPTGAELLADITAHAIWISRQRQNISGLYHLAAAGETSWYGYANFVLNFARQEGVKLTVAPENVFPVTSSEFPSAARRPKNSRLDTGKLQSTFDLSLPSWETGVARMLTEILEKPL